MTRASFRNGLALFLVAAVAATPAAAAPIVAGATVLRGTAIQDITLLPNTPFNPTASPILIDDLFGIGSITINRDTQVGSTIPIASLAGGLFYGSDPLLGSFVFGNVPPLTGADFSGVITDVVQDPSDPGFATGQPSSFQSGDFSFGGASFGFEFLTGPAAGIKLFTDPAVPFAFSAAFDGLPPSAGTVLNNSGPAVLDVLFNGQVVAQSSDRRIVLSAVPEPSSLALSVMAVVVMAVVVVVRSRTGVKPNRCRFSFLAEPVSVLFSRSRTGVGSLFSQPNRRRFSFLAAEPASVLFSGG